MTISQSGLCIRDLRIWATTQKQQHSICKFWRMQRTGSSTKNVNNYIIGYKTSIPASLWNTVCDWFIHWTNITDYAPGTVVDIGDLIKEKSSCLPRLLTVGEREVVNSKYHTLWQVPSKVIKDNTGRFWPHSKLAGESFQEKVNLNWDLMRDLGVAGEAW